MSGQANIRRILETEQLILEQVYASLQKQEQAKEQLHKENLETDHIKIKVVDLKAQQRQIENTMLCFRALSDQKLEQLRLLLQASI